jgi:hypothetical protein
MLRIYISGFNLLAAMVDGPAVSAHGERPRKLSNVFKVRQDG